MPIIRLSIFFSALSLVFPPWLPWWSTIHIHRSTLAAHWLNVFFLRLCKMMFFSLPHAKAAVSILPAIFSCIIFYNLPWILGYPDFFFYSFLLIFKFLYLIYCIFYFHTVSCFIFHLIFYWIIGCILNTC